MNSAKLTLTVIKFNILFLKAGKSEITANPLQEFQINSFVNFRKISTAFSLHFSNNFYAVYQLAKTF
jgi:hypothetical protein